MAEPQSEPYADRFDPEVAAGFIRANDKPTGLPKFLGLRIVDIGRAHRGVISAVRDQVLGCVCYPVMKRGQWAATTAEGRLVASAQDTVTIRDPKG